MWGHGKLNFQWYNIYLWWGIYRNQSYWSNCKSRPGIQINRIFNVDKVECVFLMVILSEFRMGQHRDDDHQKDAPHFIDQAIYWFVSLLKEAITNYHHGYWKAKESLGQPIEFKRSISMFLSVIEFPRKWNFSNIETKFCLPWLFAFLRQYLRPRNALVFESSTKVLFEIRKFHTCSENSKSIKVWCEFTCQTIYYEWYFWFQCSKTNQLAGFSSRTWNRIRSLLQIGIGNIWCRN